MPLFDFTTSRTPVVKPYFWIYWAVTIPLTISVVAVYQTYLVWTGRKNRAEDKKARKAVTQSVNLPPPEFVSDEEPAPQGSEPNQFYQLPSRAGS
jgi:hypothetical protein